MVHLVRTASIQAILVCRVAMASQWMPTRAAQIRPLRWVEAEARAEMVALLARGALPAAPMVETAVQRMQRQRLLWLPARRRRTPMLKGGNGGGGGAQTSGFFFGVDGNGGNGGSGDASATAQSGRGDVTVSASATGGAGGRADPQGNGGNGASGAASATGSSIKGNVTVSASAIGGAGGREGNGFDGSWR